MKKTARSEEKNVTKESNTDEIVRGIISKVVKEVEDNLGKGVVVSLGQETLADVKDWIPSGCLVLDKILSGGYGYPVNRIIEIFGEEGTGKTTLGIVALAETQKKGGIAMMIDTETSYDRDRAKTLGLNIPELLYYQVETIEEVFKVMELSIEKIRSIDKNRLITILWDSAAATSTKQEIEGEMGDSGYFGSHAKLLSQGFRKFKRYFTWANVTLIIVNQVREMMQTGFFAGKKFTTFGGKAIGFYSSVRMEVSLKEKLKSGNNITGVKVRVRTRKNKVYAPFKECNLVIDFDSGIDDIGSSVLYLVDNKVLVDRLGWIQYNGAKYRYNDLVKYFEANRKELIELVKGVKEI